jgi:hypothetical protein
MNYRNISKSYGSKVPDPQGLIVWDNNYLEVHYRE